MASVTLRFSSLNERQMRDVILAHHHEHETDTHAAHRGVRRARRPSGRGRLMGAATDTRKALAARLAENMGLDPDDLFNGAMAAWSNLNPDSVPFERGLSVAAAVLSATKET